jgi:collagenase-like PrtC family protease
MMKNNLELLAPAGDWAALQAALDAGASAVYLGLTTLNARRRASNFRQDEFARAVEAAHARGVRVYLTLNIDLAQRDLGQAARLLELARQCRADAVLVRDPAMLALRPLYPELEFHFSTQTCIANSADVTAAGELGASRVVLAREMTLAEIAAASKARGVKTEVFVQGALCFSVSGRCALASWAGGRSGNRGTCTSPCRVPWTIDGRPAGTPMSMRDLSAIERLDEIRAAGATAVKIEGRLKNAAWVQKAVGLYRRALDGQILQDFRQEVRELGAYTGRELTCGYLDGDRENLTGLAGRESLEKTAESDSMDRTLTSDDSQEQENTLFKGDSPIFVERKSGQSPTYSSIENGRPDASYSLEIAVGEKRIECCCQCGETIERWNVPKTVVRRANKAVSIGDMLQRLSAAPLNDHRLERSQTNDPDYLLVPRAAGALIDRAAAVIRRANRPPDEMVRIDLPPAVRAALENGEPARGNRLLLCQSIESQKMNVGRATNESPVFHGKMNELPDISNLRINKLSQLGATAGLSGSAGNTVGQANRDTLKLNLDRSLCLGDPPDRVRLEAKAVAGFLKNVHLKTAIVEGLTARNLDQIASDCRETTLVAALPSVFFEDDIPGVKQLLKQCAKARIAVEVNSWGGWRLAKEAGLRMEGGPGLPVLNALAARTLAECGMECVTLSQEADRRQLEEATACCGAPCSLVVFGRPVLAVSRVGGSFLGENVADATANGGSRQQRTLGLSASYRILEDRRGVRLTAQRQRGLWVLRPEQPYDLRGCRNERIRARHLVVDLVGSSDPAGDWYDVPLPKSRPHLFNYDRTLA